MPKEIVLLYESIVSVLAKAIESISKEFGLFNHCSRGWNIRVYTRIIQDSFKHRKAYDYTSVCDLIRVYFYLTFS